MNRSTVFPLAFAPLLATALLFAPPALLAADRAAPPSAPLLGVPDKLLLADDFEGDCLGPLLRSPIPSFLVRDGVLVGRQERPDHGGTLHAPLAAPNGDVILEVKIRFAGARSLSIGCDDRTFRGAHAGHIAGLNLKPRGITLLDKKEGRMRNDIYALRRSGDPAQKAEGDRLLAGREVEIPFAFQTGRWYAVGLEIVGDRMRVSVDGQAVGELQSPGLAHSTKPDLRLSAWGKEPSDEAHFDELRVWSVKRAAKP